jgi:hypothetical protein
MVCQGAPLRLLIRCISPCQLANEDKGYDEVCVHMAWAARTPWYRHASRGGGPIFFFFFMFLAVPFFLLYRPPFFIPSFNQEDER